MGDRAATQLVSTGSYLTDERRLVFVLDLPEPDQAIIEDARTGEVKCIPSRSLLGWRVVEPRDG